MLTVNHTVEPKVPYWNEIKDLGKSEKIRLIALLSSSLISDKNVVSEKNRTQEMIDRCCGSWTGTQTAEETPAEKTKRMIAKYAGCWNGNDTAEDTIRAITDGRHSTMEPLSI